MEAHLAVVEGQDIDVDVVEGVNIDVVEGVNINVEAEVEDELQYLEVEVNDNNDIITIEEVEDIRDYTGINTIVIAHTDV